MASEAQVKENLDTRYKFTFAVCRKRDSKSLQRYRWFCRYISDRSLDRIPEYE